MEPKSQENQSGLFLDKAKLQKQTTLSILKEQIERVGTKPGAVAHAFNPSTLESKAGDGYECV